MKKVLFAIASMAAIDVAYAQSSVTLYGLIDEGVNYISNAKGGQLYNLSSGVHNGDRWGLRGSEDLGGGLKAIFLLENGFEINSGKLNQGGLLFGRQAYVGLGSPYGTVTLGRQYDSIVDYTGPFAVADQWGGNISAHPADLDNFNNDNRVNNSIKYTSVNYAGLTFGGLYSLGGVAGSFSENQIYSLGASYANGPFALAVAYLNIKDPNVSFFGNAVAGATAATNNFGASPVINGFASAKSQQVIGAGTSYQIGAATLGATYSNIQFKNLSGVAGVLNPAGLSGTATFNSMEFNVSYQVTPKILLGGAYGYTRGNSLAGKDGPKYNQFAVGADYFLSKRTDVYVIGIYQKASGTQSDGHEAVASISTLTPSSSDRQSTVRLGIRHKF